MKCESACCCDGPNAAIDGAGVMDVGWVAERQEPALAEYIVQHELKDFCGGAAPWGVEISKTTASGMNNRSDGGMRTVKLW